MTKASANVFPKLIGAEGAAPGTPAAATAILYVKADGLWYSKDDAGVETLVSGGVAGAAAFVGCRAYNSTTQTVTAATETTVLFDSEEYDTDAIHDIVTNTGRFTVPAGKAGKWRFVAHVFFAGSHGNSYGHLRKNGATDIVSSAEGLGSTGDTVFPTALIVLAEGDYIEVRAYRTTGTTFGATTSTSSCAMEAEFVGA